MNSIILITSYILIVNLLGFAAMGIDKHKAKAGSFLGTRQDTGTL